MSTHVVIAILSAIYRKGLTSLFSDETSAVCEVETRNELERKLRIEQMDFVIAGQSLVNDMSLLPKGKFVLMAREPDREYFVAAVSHGACGYFLYTVSADLIRQATQAPPGHCYLDPALTVWAAGLLAEKEQLLCDAAALTAREREVLALKKQHLSTCEIAARLHVSETTVKKHVHHILQKLHPDGDRPWKP